MGDSGLELILEAKIELLFSEFSLLEGSIRSAVGFIDLESDFLRVGGLGVKVPTSVVLDASPYILPLAQFQDSYETFVLVLIDGQYSQIHLVHDALGEMFSEQSHSALGSHRRGGWSQARYQRARQGVVNAFFDQVSSDLHDLISSSKSKRIIVAGSGTSKYNFVERLPQKLRDLVSKIEDIDTKLITSDSIFRRFSDIAKSIEEKEEIAIVNRLKKSLLTDQLAIMDVYEILGAAELGRVELLIVAEGFSLAGIKCEGCNYYIRQSGMTCPTCDGKGNEVDLINEAVEAIIRTSANVEFTSNPYVESIGGLGALLRW